MPESKSYQAVASPRPVMYAALACNAAIALAKLLPALFSGSARYGRRGRLLDRRHDKSGDGLDWHANRQARAFYGTIAAATLLGALANLASVNAMQSLVWVAVINGMVAVPVMALLMLMAADPRILGRFTVSRIWQVLG